MLRLTMLLLCFVLAGAAAGRYKAEAAVRETRSELRSLEREKAEEATKIQVLRAEVAYLENPERLSAIAGKMTGLEPMSGAQLLTADDFRLAFGAASGRSGVVEEASRPVDVAEIDASSLR